MSVVIALWVLNDLTSQVRSSFTIQERLLEVESPKMTSDDESWSILLLHIKVYSAGGNLFYWAHKYSYDSTVLKC